MNLIPETVTRGFGRAMLKTQKNSPHILFGLGIAGVITSTVLACRATLKLEKSLDEIKTDLESVKMLGADSKRADTPYHRQEYARDLGYVYGKSAAKFVKLYGPSVIIGTASIAALSKSHTQLSRRNAALTFTLAAVTKAYEEYRSRVQEEIGESRELALYRNIQNKEVENKEGKKEIVQIVNPKGGSIYARLFEEGNVNFLNSNEYNRIFIEIQQKHANDLLNVRGHVFLNEIYDMLGIPRSQPGAVVGWLKNGDGDGYIDFGIYDGPNQTRYMGIGQTFYLDFNVDGVIWDLI